MHHKSDAIISDMTQKTLLTALGIGVFGLLMLSNPRCNRGCKSIAEHLVSHAVDDLIAGLLA